MKLFSDMGEDEQEDLLDRAEDAVSDILPEDIEYVLVIGSPTTGRGGCAMSDSLSPKRLRAVLRAAYKASIANESGSN